MDGIFPIPGFSMGGDIQRSLRDLGPHGLDSLLSSFRRATTTKGFARSNYGDIRSFFDEAAADYDSDLTSPYWAFSHDILKHLLRVHILPHFAGRTRISVLDAGAGTGNWSKFIHSLGDNIDVTLFDMNPSMLRQARKKLNGDTGGALRFVEGQLEIASEFVSELYDVILCFHNVIGLGRSSAKMLRSLALHLKPGGLAFIMTPNKYHAAIFSIMMGNERELQRVVEDGTIRFKENMPEMFCYTPAELDSMLDTAGFINVKVLGFPVSVYPQPQDVDLLVTSTTNAMLNDAKRRAQLLSLEKTLCLNPELAYRAGNSLLAVGSRAVAH